MVNRRIKYGYNFVKPFPAPRLHLGLRIVLSRWPYTAYQCAVLTGKSLSNDTTTDSLDDKIDLKPSGEEGTRGELEAALRETPLFSILDDMQIKSLTEKAAVQAFVQNETIVHEGDTATNFFVILDGQVEVMQAGRSLAKLGRGQFFGETSLLGDETRSADVVTLRETRCLVMSRAELRQVIGSTPAVALKFVEESARRYRPRAPDPSGPAAASRPASAAEPLIEFKLEKTKLLFESFVKAFVEDYMVKRRYFEQSGWRTFSELSAATKISHAALYGKQGKYGPNVSELLSRGLIEMRVFTGERGRGGEVVRARVAYDKEPVKHYVDQVILKRK
jgi:hypothetical protein